MPSALILFRRGTVSKKIDLKDLKLEDLTDEELKALEEVGILKKTESGEYIVRRKIRTK